MVYSFKNNNLEMSVEEMRENTFKNIDTLNNLSRELKNLRLGNEKGNNSRDINKVIVSSNEYSWKNKEENPLLEEINYYYLRVKDLNLDSSYEVLKKELPSRRNSNYQNIILGINAFLMRDINEIRDFMELDKENISKEELLEFRDEISDIKRIINAILEIGLYNELITLDDNEEDRKFNNVVFLETKAGNIYALEDLKDIPGEYYDGFYELISSIQDGTFKNVKYLAGSNNKVIGVAEVKGFKRRVIFDRINSDTYVILGIFTKKSDNDKGYLVPLENRIAVYRNNKDEIVRNLKKEGYLEFQEKILEEVYELLKTKGRRKG